MLTGLADAYIANAQPAKAIDYLTALKATRAAAAPPLSASAKTPSSSEASSSSKAAPPVKAATPTSTPASPASASPTSTSAAPTSPPPAAAAADATPGSSVDAAALDLLLAKVYSSWGGHDNDALAAYDGLIKALPEDFRGYLAKGLFLKEHGRKADAERMFLQVGLASTKDSSQTWCGYGVDSCHTL